ncbi:DUF6241 domain-containing protein [Sporosarcina trichiuri]|uniref:DUF6241 domain-containing protein n=1 Tax=Sporosarcina trichiuri TaxID=3056445 RepID=UPI0025B4B11B|nr:DUF6241 domain-containing protein [Sporosarcina sp. 0.2-SM1T-5]WJY28049.1 DUF6241 domain-containing protein [Sporosarcina sp. 0.2-SM1T-5]
MEGEEFYEKTLIILGVVLIGAAAYFLINEPGKDRVTIKKTNRPTENSGKAPILTIEEDRDVPVEEEFPASMDQLEVENAIHDMSHQKVRAEDKWGFLPMTQDRVERLTEVVEKNKKKYGKNADVYLDILQRWSNDDFSAVDQDHNTIWDMQGGTVGKATGILTIEQEQEFIRKHYKTNE